MWCEIKEKNDGGLNQRVVLIMASSSIALEPRLFWIKVCRRIEMQEKRVERMIEGEWNLKLNEGCVGWIEWKRAQFTKQAKTVANSSTENVTIVMMNHKVIIG